VLCGITVLPGRGVFQFYRKPQIGAQFLKLNIGFEQVGSGIFGLSSPQQTFVKGKQGIVGAFCQTETLVFGEISSVLEQPDHECFGFYEDGRLLRHQALI
jgi:hypothetical protein